MAMADPPPPAPVDFDRTPESYRHWRLVIEPPLARLELDVDEDAALFPGQRLKLNSYDLGVDVELHDAVQRIRFTHPEVRAVVITSAKPGVFCAGAHIGTLAAAPHEWKTNFCRFTNETRNAIEEAAADSGLRFLAAVNGSCAGGGYELALACEEILLVDDGSSAVALPEVPLLGVLPGTGGLTRLTDKRGVRRDLADVLATRPDGVRGRTAVDWRLVDAAVPRRDFERVVGERARALAEAADSGARPTAGIELPPLDRKTADDRIEYRYVRAGLDRGRRLVELTLLGPPTAGAGATEAAEAAQGAQGAESTEAGDPYWLLTLARELDDAILRLRFNEPELGTWVIRTEGDPDAVLAHESRLLAAAAAGDRVARETLHLYKRTLKRLDVTGRSLIALIEPGSCCAGLLLEPALACDRQYLLDTSDDPGAGPPARITLSAADFGQLPMGNGLTRLRSRFLGDPAHVEALRSEYLGRPLGPAEARALGLVTDAPDDLDWADEIRLVLEARAALSPDALTAMEANLRFAGPETTETKIFGRLTAWQNWIFTRPNASGPDGALRSYGSGHRPGYRRKRT
ncbi:2,3-epoxybenzoyl-CoA dihydrolase [Phaeacidiphilus oryzae]|uniref:2,3-epoxybenzoyl-CoA dihydrolase n=1 Tax=Phaeacidiphilus oryzae TaxID=348818 RepID=UPI000A058007|nr:2,3-epoxybenzoyl-CoA dihydrolase [Phaeacidiphilus oryzae]